MPSAAGPPTGPGTEPLGDGAIGGIGHGEGAPGVRGINFDPGGIGVQGVGAGSGVAGLSQDGLGVRGDSLNGFAAVHGHGGRNGVWGFTVSANDGGVFGQNDGGGSGVAGFSKDGIGVRGDSPNGFAAVHGHGGRNGVWGFTVSAGDSGVFGQNDGGGNGVAGFSKDGIGVLGQGGHLAGRFQGNVEVEVGDLLTTSPTPGHAMKAADSARAFGSVIGKALRPLKTGQGMIPILIALQ